MGAAEQRRHQRLEAAFAEEELRGLRMAARVRTLVLAVIGIWITIENGYPECLFFYPYVVLFGVLGVGPYLLRRRGVNGAWVQYVFPLLDIALLVAAITIPNPLVREVLPPQSLLHHGNEVYLFIFICAAVFTYSPRVVLWTGFCAALAWSAVNVAMLMLPDTVVLVWPEAWHSLSDEELLRLALDPHLVNLGLWGREVVLFLLTSAALAAFVWRARRLVEHQADVERERANLSRYFSPNLVDELSRADQPLGATRQQDVAVLFADIAGFTTTSETLPPDRVIELLRDFHGRMQRAVFEHGGTLDKYIGDGLMATFGTPHAGPNDAGNALACAVDMIAAVGEWNRERAGRGEAPIRIGVGVHYGPVVLGDIGGEQRLEFAVVGDTVNVASRLERLTRELQAAAVTSDAVIEAARGEGRSTKRAEALFVPGPEINLRGRDAPVRVWLLEAQPQPRV